MTDTFRSKIDGWLLLTLAAALLLPMLAPALMLMNGVAIPRSAALIFAGTVILTACLPLWIIFGTSYRIEGGTLRIRSGPIRWNIPVNSITAVGPSRSWLAGPALSLDRLEISHGAGARIMVSPEDQAGFIAALRRSGAPV